MEVGERTNVRILFFKCCLDVLLVLFRISIYVYVCVAWLKIVYNFTATDKSEVKGVPIAGNKTILLFAIFASNSIRTEWLPCTQQQRQRHNTHIDSLFTVMKLIWAELSWARKSIGTVSHWYLKFIKWKTNWPAMCPLSSCFCLFLSRAISIGWTEIFHTETFSV